MHRFIAKIVTSLALATPVLASVAAEARPVRGGTRTSVNHAGSASANRSTNANRNTNVNRNVNVHNDIDVDVDRHYGGYGGGYHPVARAAAVTTAAVATAAVVGSVVSTIPTSCVQTVVDGVVYQQCGSTWYAPRYYGSSVSYVVVNPP